MRQLAPGYLDWDTGRFSGSSIQPSFLDLIWERQPDGSWSLVHESFVQEKADIAAAKYAAGLLSSVELNHKTSPPPPTPTPLLTFGLTRVLTLQSPSTPATTCG